MDSSDKLPRHLAIGFALALVVYIGFFSCDQHVRQRKGPWEVRFGTNANGLPAITIDQHALSISNVQLVFKGERVTNNGGTVVFDKPLQPLPFGTLKFEDLTYLPGSVVFDLFGHEVELLPRVLYLNKKEHAWQPGLVVTLEPTEKLPPGASVDPRKKKRRPFSGQ